MLRMGASAARALVGASKRCRVALSTAAAVGTLAALTILLLLLLVAVLTFPAAAVAPAVATFAAGDRQRNVGHAASVVHQRPWRTRLGDTVWNAALQDISCRSRREEVRGPTNASEGSRSSGLTMRVMFIGDSITTGIARRRDWGAATVRNGRRHPDAGTCSYRPTLLGQLAQAAGRAGVVVRAVGPFSGGFAGPTPPWCWENEGAPQRHRDVASVAALDAHAATWGIRAAQVIRGESSRKRGAAPRARPNGGSDAAAWMAAFRPDLVTVLLGTNDVTASGDARLALANVEQVLRDVLQGGGVSPRALGSCECPVRVVVAQLLPRSTLQDVVSEFNELVHNAVVKCRGIALPVPGDARSPSEWSPWCHRCVSLADSAGTASWGSGSSTAFDPAAHLYDGIHPNHRGEVIVGRNIAVSILS